jgi:phenylalanyl-tRNA synthetase alpha chain
MTALQQAQAHVRQEHPNLPMPLRFEVSLPDTIQRLLTITDLTLPTPPGQERNVVGRIFDQLVRTLEERHFPDIRIIRGSAIVAARDNFDRLLFSPGNPGRSSTYTRYTDEDHVLRTHTSALIPSTFERLQSVVDRSTYVLPGLVYRRDVIDPRHLDVFHQIDVWTLQDSQTYGKTARADLLELADTVFEAACPGARMVVYEATHPYTQEGIEVYANIGGIEIEVLEAGLIHPEVLRHAGLDPERYRGLALGMGVERLIMARKHLPDIRLIRSTDPRVRRQMTTMEAYLPVSNQPAMTRDLSYCVAAGDTEEDVCEQIKIVFGDQADLLEQVEILERTPYAQLAPIARERLGATPGQDNVLVRITLRHPDTTLTKQEAAHLYAMAYPQLHQGMTKGYERTGDDSE